MKYNLSYLPIYKISVAIIRGHKFPWDGPAYNSGVIWAGKKLRRIDDCQTSYTVLVTRVGGAHLEGRHSVYVLGKFTHTCMKAGIIQPQTFKIKIKQNAVAKTMTVEEIIKTLSSLNLYLC